MRIVRYVDDFRTAYAREHPDGTLTRLTGEILDALGDTCEPVVPTKILAPIEPSAIIGIGLNYRKHASETGKDLPGTKGVSAFVVEPEFPGFSVGSHEDKMGLRGSNTTSLVMDDCEVPIENLSLIHISEPTRPTT